MRNRFILLICAVMLLSGCGIPVKWPTQPSGTSIGRTYEQLVEAKRSDQQVQIPSQWRIGAADTYYCNASCNGQPARTYTNPAGNKVAAYVYTDGWNFFSRFDAASQCFMVEERYELQNNVVVDEWYVYGHGEKLPLHTPNVCDGYDRVDAKDPPLGPRVPDMPYPYDPDE